MKVISFSLWGTNQKYLQGAIQNATLVKTIYPDWVCWFYCGTSVPNPVKFKLKDLGAKIINMPDFGDWTSMMWRFFPVSDASVEVVIIRDADSRLNYREAAAVKEWIDSDKSVHIIRDHPFHKFPIMPGMCGFKRGAYPFMAQLIKSEASKSEYGFDYHLFADKVLPNIDKSNIMIHDEFFGGRQFPIKRNGLEFVGEVYDENNKPNEEHRQILKRHLNG